MFWIPPIHSSAPYKPEHSCLLYFLAGCIIRLVRDKLPGQDASQPNEKSLKNLRRDKSNIPSPRAFSHSHPARLPHLPLPLTSAYLQERRALRLFLDEHPLQVQGANDRPGKTLSHSTKLPFPALAPAACTQKDVTWWEMTCQLRSTSRIQEMNIVCVLSPDTPSTGKEPQTFSPLETNVVILPGGHTLPFLFGEQLMTLSRESIKCTPGWPLLLVALICHFKKGIF